MRVIITGATGGIGTATVGRCCAARARRSSGSTSPADIECDVRDQASVDRAVAAAIERLGGLDVLINNAGARHAAERLAAARRGRTGGPGRQPGRSVARDLRGPAALRASRGRVVNVASGLAHITVPFATAYTLSKRGVVAYSDSLRLEEGDRITVTTVYPGYIRTPIHEHSIAAGVPLDGAVPAERVEDAARTLVRAALGPPVRDLATTRQGDAGYRPRPAGSAPAAGPDHDGAGCATRQRGHFPRTVSPPRYAARLRD